MNIILMGTSSWVIPVFDRAANEHNVAAVFTRAPKPAGRKQELTKSPVHVWAESRGIPVYTNINEFDDVVKNLDVSRAPPMGGGLPAKRTGGASSNKNNFTGESPSAMPHLDAIIVASYGVILRDNILNAAPCVNIHPSDLPKYRGPSPIVTAVYNGDTESAVCLMQVTTVVDSGDVFMRRPFSIGENDTIADVESRVGAMSADMLSDFLTAPEKYPPRPQVGEPTFTRKFAGADELIDWSRSTRDIHNRVRAIGGRTKINGLDVKILETKITGGRMEIIRVQPAGKKPMPWRDFLNGQRGKIQFGK